MELKDITKEATVVQDTTTLKDVIAIMVHSQTNSLLVTNTDDELIGEVGVSDLLDAIVPEYLEGDSVATHFATEEMFSEAVRNAAGKPVTEFMSTDINPITPIDNLMTVAATAIAQRKARIPVVDEDNHPIGLVSRRGLKHILANYLGISDPAAD